MTDYNSLTRTQLIKLVKQRSLYVPTTNKRGVPPKTDYIRTLVIDDDRKTNPFRFTDLPPELRNRVYRELLTFEAGWTCFPQILSTCKQVYEEAPSILYGENLIEIKVWEWEVQTHGIGSWEYPRRDQGAVGAYSWPAMLHRVQYLRVSMPAYEILVNLDVTCRPHKIMNTLLYSLCSFLADDNSLRSLEVDLTPLPFDFEREEHLTVLYPLSMLGQLPQLTIKLQDRSDIKLTNSMVQHPPMSLADNKIYPSALRLSRPYSTYDAAASGLNKVGADEDQEVQDVGRKLTALVPRWYSSYYDAEWETCTVNAIEDLQLAFRRSDAVKRSNGDVKQAVLALEQAKQLARRCTRDMENATAALVAAQQMEQVFQGCGPPLRR